MRNRPRNHHSRAPCVDPGAADAMTPSFGAPTEFAPGTLVTSSSSSQAPRLTRDQLANHLHRAENPSEGLIGTEFEAIILHAQNSSPRVASYNQSVAPVLQALCEEFAWTAGPNRGNQGEIVELRRNGASITLEPGGQIELSGAPQENVHATCQEFRQHRRELDAVGKKLGLSFLATGFHPFATREEIQWMPKGRYEVMRNYLPTQGSRALDMMLRTCTVQVNLDYPNEQECGRRFCSMLKASSLLTALFANSPYKEGQATGYHSERSRVWSEVDPKRCGLPPFAFEENFSYEKYVDWVLQVPMFFIYREGQYIPYHQPFSSYLADGFVDDHGQRHYATLADWELHLSTVFPEVRLKPYIEIRGADAVSHRYLCALPALSKGLLYDDQSLSALEELVSGLSPQQAQDRWERARKFAFQDPDILALCQRMLRIARDGLDRLDASLAPDAREACFLDPLQELLDRGATIAQASLSELGERPTPLALSRHYHYAGAPVFST